MKKNHIIISLIIMVSVTFMVYSGVINGEFQFDDEKGIVENIAIKEPGRSSYNGFFMSLLYSGRPVTDMTFALNYRFGRLDPMGYHLINILLHICVSVLVFLFIKKTIVLSCTRSPFTPGPIALTASFIFALHPLNTQAVSYISQRAEVLSALFYLSALLFLIKSVEQRLFLRKAFLYTVAVLSWILSTGAKMTAISLPFVMLVYDYYFLKERTFIDRIKLSGPLILGGIAFSAVYLFRLGASQEIGFSINDLSSSRYLLTQFKVIITYIRLLFLPVLQNLDYEYPVSRGLFEIRTALSMLAVSAIIGLAVILRHRSGLISFGVLWFFLTLAPTSSIIPVRDVIFEHRVYLPSIGLILSAAFILMNVSYLLLSKYGQKIRNAATAVVIVAVIAALAATTWKRNEVWKSRQALWSDVVSKSPGKSRAHFNLGHALLEKGLYAGAIRELETALKCRDDGSVDKADIYRELGAVLFRMGRIDEAITVYREGLSFSPAHTGLLNNFTIALLEKGGIDEAFVYADMALKTAPFNGDIHNSMGEIYFRKGEYSKAAGHFIKAIELNPDIPLRYWNAAISMEKLGNIREAYKYMNLYISIEKNEADRNEALIYMENLKNNLDRK
ncbi:MAG: tetratricopeptide repeat protein [Nitrospirota bacterium]